VHPSFVAKLRRARPARAVLSVETRAVQKQMLERIGLAAKRLGFAPRLVAGKGEATTLYLEWEGHKGYTRDTATVSFGENQHLQMGLGWESEPVPIVDEAHALAVLDEVRERLALDAARADKTAKLKSLRVRAFEGRLRAIAAARKTEFAITGMHGKVQMALRIDERRSLIIDLPYRAELQEVDAIGPLYDDVRGLFDRGVRFDVGSAQRIRRWTKP
jgi:hypothetical protein